jgi:cell division GTPase FtsZ
MSEIKPKNRVVVVNESTGDVVRLKSDAEIVQENEDLEAALKLKEPEEEKRELDPSVLEKLKNKQEAKQEDEVMKAIAKRDRSLYFGTVGLGQAGSRVCEIFYNFGYESCVFNTATQDLEHIKLPDKKKIFLPFALGGAGKELDNGRLAIEQNAEKILEDLNNNFDETQEMLILAVSGGGGTGSGGAEAILGLMATLGKPIGVIYILPMESEDALSKHNSVVTLGKLAKMASTDAITTLIVVDNSKIELMYPGLSKAEFWTTANHAIVEPLHLFNHLSAMSTPYDSLDSMDFGRVFTTGDCTIYGMLEVEDFMETTAIAEAIIENLEAGLLVSDFNLKETRFGGYIVVANPETLKKLPAVNIDYANHVISEACDSPSLVRGVYEMDIEDDLVRVYTLFSGLGLPAPRVESLQKQATEQMAIIREKEKTRADRMNVEYGAGNDTQAKSQEVHRIIQQKKSGFGKLTTNAGQKVAGKRIIDRRKR